MKLTGGKLRLLRQARSMKQRELANKMGIKQQRLSILENSPAKTDGQIKKAFTALRVSEKEAEEFFRMFTPPVH